jgi:hypothetical protein
MTRLVRFAVVSTWLWSAAALGQTKTIILPPIELNPDTPAPRWRPPTALGRTTCGGWVNGTLQPECTMQPATFERKLRLACPKGSFFDLGLGQCWSCPDGYHRTAHAVTDDKACAKAMRRKGVFGAAQFKGKRCPEGSFFDPIRDGECWACPAGYKRTVTPVDHAWACQKKFGGPFAKAKVVKKAQCEAGEFLDPRNGGECWRCEDGFARTVFPVHGEKACERSAFEDLVRATFVSKVACQAGEHFDLVDGGTCWSCPEGYKRSMRNVKGNAACRPGDIVWQPAAVQEPGIFGLAGADEAVLELVHTPRTIDTLIKANADAMKIDYAFARKEAWTGIADNPATSTVLGAALFVRILGAIGRDDETPAMKTFLGSFAAYLRARRIQIAKEALAAYDAWKAAVAARKAKSQSAAPGQMQTLFDIGTAPPDFEQILRAGVLANVGKSAGVGVLAGMILGDPAVLRIIFPYRKGLSNVAVSALRQAVSKLGQKLGMTALKELGKAALKTAFKSLAGVGSALGPVIIITVAMMIGSAAWDLVMAQRDARPKLEANLATAEQPLDLLRLLQSEGGPGEIQGYWTLAVSGTKYAPSRNMAAEISKVARAQAAKE